MNNRSINLEDKFTKITRYWSPQIIARMNDYHFKLVRIVGDPVWHHHVDKPDLARGQK